MPFLILRMIPAINKQCSQNVCQCEKKHSCQLRRMATVTVLIVTRGNSIQPGNRKRLKCRIFGNDMLQHETVLKTRRLFGCDIL